MILPSGSLSRRVPQPGCGARSRLPNGSFPSWRRNGNCRPSCGLVSHAVPGRGRVGIECPLRAGAGTCLAFITIELQTLRRAVSTKCLRTRRPWPRKYATRSSDRYSLESSGSNMNSRLGSELLYLSRADVASAGLDMAAIIAALENMFHEKGEG